MFRHFGWSHVALLAEDSQEYPEYHQFLDDHFLAAGMSVVYQRTIHREATHVEITKVGFRFREKFLAMMNTVPSVMARGIFLLTTLYE